MKFDKIDLYCYTMFVGGLIISVATQQSIKEMLFKVMLYYVVFTVVFIGVNILKKLL